MDRRTLLALAVALLLPAVAHAQAFRAYLSSTGSDAGPCSLAAPCRLLPAALAAVADGGEVWMLDSANYNTATVNVAKSVTILAVPGAIGSVVARGGDAIAINTAGVKVVLRNLVIVPLPGQGGVNGVSVGAPAALTVERCLIANLPGHGIVAVTATSVRIMDSTIRDNGDVGVWLIRGVRGTVTRSVLSGNGSSGLFVISDAASTLTTADVADSTLDGNGNGVLAWSENSATATVRVSVRDSRLVGNANFGAQAKATSGSSAILAAASSIVSNNSVGIQAANPGAAAWISGNTVSANATGFSNASALFETAGNNALRNNVTDTAGTVTAVPML